MYKLRDAIITGLCLASVLGAASARAQTTAAAPSVNANIWNGKDHQPTASSAPPLSAKHEKKVDTTLNALDKQLLDQKLPKAPAGSP
jgi:hypothetical protein